ncbi:MAG: hypothetical protein HQL22_02840 [Candidatus Omnitrophica bacterium]|nr:hypothetical protein [Candidatus Omnitrophota bacterium]
MSNKVSFITPILAVSATLLFLAVFFKLPYGFYTLLRVVISITSCFMVIAAYKWHRHGWMVVFGLIGLLFNPFILVHFDRVMWRVIDFAVGVLLVFCIFKIRMKRNV